MVRASSEDMGIDRFSSVSELFMYFNELYVL
jgi:hypothetical protein